MRHSLLLKASWMILSLFASAVAHAIQYRVDMVGPGILLSDEFGLFGPASSQERTGEVRVSFQFEVPAPDSKPPTRSYFVLQEGQAAIEIAMFGRSIRTGIDYALLEFNQYQAGDFTIYGAPGDGPGAMPSGLFGFGVIPGPLASGRYPDPLYYPYAEGAGNFSFYDQTPGSSRDTSLQFTDYRPAVVTTLSEPPSAALALGALALAAAASRRRARAAPQG